VTEMFKIGHKHQNISHSSGLEFYLIFSTALYIYWNIEIKIFHTIIGWRYDQSLISWYEYF